MNKRGWEVSTCTRFKKHTKNIHRFKGKSKISTWLCQIAKYTFYQYLEEKARSMCICGGMFLALTGGSWNLMKAIFRMNTDRRAYIWMKWRLTRFIRRMTGISQI